MASQFEADDQRSLLIESHHPKSKHDSPASRLSPELLEPIVALAAMLDKYEDSFRVVPYSHVCRSWRSVVISTPLLWRYINVKSPHFMAECLLRSKSVPIWVTNDLLYKHTPQSYAYLWNFHGHRIAKIYIFVTDLSDLHLFHGTFPFLTELSLLNYNDMPVVLPFCNFLALRDLSLHGVILLDEMWNFVSGLTCLNISYLEIHTAPFLRQILGVIARSPQLSSISLRGSLRLSDDLDSMPILYPSHLQTIYMSWQEVPLTLHFLSKLQLPLFCHLTLEVPIIDSLDSILPPIVMNNFQILDRSCVQVHNSGFRLYEVTDSNEEHRIFSIGGAEITFQSLSHTFQFFDLAKLTFLEIRTDLGLQISQEDWSVLFTQLPSLTSLELTSELNLSDRIPILNALIDVSATSAVACPQLRWISIRSLEHNVTPWKHWRVIQEVIVLWLLARADLGVAIHDLCIKGFEIRSEFLKSVQNLVDVVDTTNVVETWEEGTDDEDSNDERYEGPGSSSSEYQ